MGSLQHLEIFLSRLQLRMIPIVGIGPIRAARQEPAEILAQLLDGRPVHVPPAVVNLVDRQIAVHGKGVGNGHRRLRLIGHIDNLQQLDYLALEITQRGPVRPHLELDQKLYQLKKIYGR
jgi:hypothetical protein